MSHGPGRLQRAILDYIDENSGSTTFESLRWHLWSKEGKPFLDGQLPKRWNSSLDRAFKKLSEKKLITTQSRRLETLGELIDHYPNKTLSVDVRELRKQLLPEIVTWLDNRPHYDTAQNEKFFIDHLNQKEFETIKSRWQRLEPRLTKLIPTFESSAQIILFSLIIKGKSIFETKEFNAKRSFSEYAQDCITSDLFSKSLINQIKSVSEALFPSAELEALRIKSYIHKCADVVQRGRCTLKPELIKYLDQTRSDIVHALPGYKAMPPQSNNIYFLKEAEATHSDLLHNLFDHSVFSKFRFVTPI